MPTGGCRRPGRRGVRGAALLLASLALVVAGCGQAETRTDAPGSTDPAMTPAGPRLRYVALGDSYTIGTSVAERARWPNQLVALEARLELVANLAANGLTSRDVIEVELPQLDALRPEFVTLLIGVNDVVQGVPAETYRRNVVRILEDAVDRVGANRVLVVTTPDYTVTPSGSDYGDPVQQAAGIRENNAIITEVAGALGITVVDIHDISLEAATDPSLVAYDRLHPSGAQYARWVERMLPSVAALLGR
jgi:acyl-CoA thioesterase I